MSFKSITLILMTGLSGLFLSACTHTSQLTSGKSYLSTYDHPAYAVQSNIDDEIKEIAAIEPRLEFPARIGLARIQNGRLTSIPADEAGAWQDLTQGLGKLYGEFVPVSPLIAAMVSQPADSTTNPAKRVVDDVRRGSARQHLDYVLIYEVTQKSDQTSNGLRLSDLTILGLYVLPSREVSIDATASAMLIDVRNGYPYGSATAFAERSKTATFAGSATAKSKTSDTARTEAVANLTHEVSAFLEDLMIASQSTNMAQNNASRPIVSKIGTKGH